MKRNSPPHQARFPLRWTPAKLREQAPAASTYVELCKLLGLRHDHNTVPLKVADTFNIDVSHISDRPEFTPYPDDKKEALIAREGGTSYKCAGCKKVLPLSEFYVTMHQVDGHTSSCRACHRLDGKMRVNAGTLREIARTVKSFSELSKKLGYKGNSANDQIRAVAAENNIDLSHLNTIKQAEAPPISVVLPSPQSDRMKLAWDKQKSIVRAHMLEDIVRKLHLLGVEFRIVGPDATYISTTGLEYEDKIKPMFVGEVVQFDTAEESALQLVRSICERIHGEYSHYAVWSEEAGLELMRVR